MTASQTEVATFLDSLQAETVADTFANGVKAQRLNGMIELSLDYEDVILNPRLPTSAGA